MLKFRAVLLATCIAATVSACKSDPLPSAVPKGDLVLFNGKIYTVNSSMPWAEAIAIKDGKIVYVGTGAEARQYADSTTQMVDLNGKMVLPGLHDVHMHPLEAGSEYVSCILEENDTLSNWVDAVRLCDTSTVGSGWLLGWGHALEPLVESDTSPRQLLDAVDASRPIAIMESTSHSVWVNSKALQMAGITANTPHPVGGAILKDAAGQPNGILLDAAGDLVFDLAYAPTPALQNDNYNALLYGLEQSAKNGITSLVDARVYWKRGYLDAWKRAEKEGTLTAHASLGLWGYPGMDDAEQLAALKSMYSNDPEQLLRINQVKLYSDGILHNTTAALGAAYLEYFDEVGPYGLNYFDKNRLARYVTELERSGFDMHIHAIGDRGVKESLDAIEAAQSSNGNNRGRHRITHVELVDAADKSRFAELGVVADFQLAGDFTHPENFHSMEPLIGERAHDMLPVKDIYDTGARITLSSDWDVSELSPFIGMQNALTRGDQSLPNLDAVIRAYTINGAYVMRQEDRAGSLEAGKWGDLIVVNQNLFEINVNDISKTQVEMTVLGGKVVYERRQAKARAKPAPHYSAARANERRPAQ